MAILIEYVRGKNEEDVIEYLNENKILAENVDGTLVLLNDYENDKIKNQKRICFLIPSNKHEKFVMGDYYVNVFNKTGLLETVGILKECLVECLCDDDISKEIKAMNNLIGNYLSTLDYLEVEIDKMDHEIKGILSHLKYTTGFSVKDKNFHDAYEIWNNKIIKITKTAITFYDFKNNFIKEESLL